MPKTKREKTVNVSLEKATEVMQETLNQSSSRLQVHPEILESIKHQGQREEEALMAQAAIIEKQNRDSFIGRLWFFGGIFAVVGVCWLAARYLKAKPDPRYVEELVNGVSQLAS